jgi:hypothetical protein
MLKFGQEGEDLIGDSGFPNPYNVFFVAFSSKFNFLVLATTPWVEPFV